jgi:hypothetical protein
MEAPRKNGDGFRLTCPHPALTYLSLAHACDRVSDGHPIPEPDAWIGLGPSPEPAPGRIPALPRRDRGVMGPVAGFPATARSRQSKREISDLGAGAQNP